MSIKDKLTYMETIGVRIKKRRKELDLTQADIGKKIGVTPVTVGHWERDTHEPSSDNILQLSKTLRTTPDQLMYGEQSTVVETNSTYSLNRENNPVPLISSVQAGNFCEAIDNLPPGDAEEWIPCHIKHSAKSFALRVEGPSMEPEFKPGEIIVVDPEREATSGSYVVAKRDEDSFVTFKQLVQTEGKNYLKALNPEWPNRIIETNGDWHICGVVIYSHRVHI